MFYQTVFLRIFDQLWGEVVSKAIQHDLFEELVLLIGVVLYGLA